MPELSLLNVHIFSERYSTVLLYSVYTKQHFSNVQEVHFKEQDNQ
jgi:hypothetical protein